MSSTPPTPPFILSGPGGTVELDCRHGPEEFQRPSQRVPKQQRGKLAASSTEPGYVSLITAGYTLNGQTMTTNHKLLTAEQDALLSKWHQDSSTLNYSDGEDILVCTILNYVARPRNRLYKWKTEVTVEELTLIFFEE